MNGWKWTILAWGVFLPLVFLFSLEYWLDKRMAKAEDMLRSEDKSLRSEMQGEEQALRGEIVRGFDRIELHFATLMPRRLEVPASADVRSRAQR
jgi:hypothetical protein